MHDSCVFTLLNWLCAGRIGWGWAHDVYTIAYHMLMYSHAYVLYILYILIYWLYWCFFACLFLPLSLVYVSCVMASNRKSTPSRNPLRSGTSTSFNPTPSHVRFRDEKSNSDFFENFSRRGVHLECQVILSDFSNTDLPTIIHSWGWESLCDVSVTCPFVLI